MKKRFVGPLALVVFGAGVGCDKLSGSGDPAATAASAAAATSAAAAANKPVTVTAPGATPTGTTTSNTTITSLDGTQKVNAAKDGGGAALNLANGKNTGSVTTDPKNGAQITQGGKTLVVPAGGGLPTSK